MKKVISYLFSDAMYAVALVLFTSYYVSTERYALASISMAAFIWVVLKLEVKMQKDNDSKSE
jgi:hypothetical protein